MGIGIQDNDMVTALLLNRGVYIRTAVGVDDPQTSPIRCFGAVLFDVCQPKIFAGQVDDHRRDFNYFNVRLWEFGP